MPLLGTVGKICHRGDIEFDWKVCKFSSLSEEEGGFYCSHPFEFGDRSWHLEFYPNGETRDHSKGCIFLYLVSESTGPPVKVLFSIGVKTTTGETAVCLNVEATFEQKNEGWSPDQWILRSELLRRKDELLPLDVLTIAVTCKVGLPRGGTKNVTVQAAAESQTTDVSVQTQFQKNVAEASVQTAIDDKVADDGKDESVEKTGAEKVLQDIRMLWASGDNSDVIIKVRDVEFKAHKSILAARTPVLGAMFQHDTTEKSSGEVTIDDCEPEVFEQLLHYIYTGAPRVVTAENASALYVVADKYLVNEIKAMCVRCMQDTLCLDTFCNTVTISLMYREQELLEVTIDFLSKNVIDVMKTVEWQVFLSEHSTRANEILIRALELSTRANEILIRTLELEARNERT